MKKRKSTMWILVLLCLSGLLAACGQQAETDWTVQQMAWAILASQGEVPVMNAPDPGAPLQTYLSGYYHLDSRQVEEGAVFYAGGVSALEVAVLRLADGAGTVEAEQALQDYIDDRAGSFAGYAPEESAILEQSTALVRGRYAALLICPDQQAAKAAFDACFTGGNPPAAAPWPSGGKLVSIDPAPAEPAAPPSDPAPQEEPSANPDPAQEAPPAVQEPPAEGADTEERPAQPPASTPDTEEPWSYDEARLLAAWEAGGWSDLADRDREILDKCREVIDSAAGPELTDYERELAVHDWMIDWAEYDRNSLDHAAGDWTDPDFETPYGLLIRQTGICRGYASTFQLFMKLIGIPCVTVEGMSHGGTDEHAWNLVELDGEWYCVDVTWDDPISNGPVSERMAHRYFNVTSEFLRQNDHQWDETQAEEAAGTAWAWQG